MLLYLISMETQYSRLSLLIGESNLKKLESKKVIVFGLGGVGGNVVDSLARSGIMNFTIVDNDTVNITNINRQLIANLNTIGKNKVDVMEQHLLSINKNIKVNKLCLFYDKDDNSIDFSKFDYVIDCIDTVSSKISIIEKAKKLNIPVISALGCGNKINPSEVEITDLSKTSYDPLAKVMRRELGLRGIKHVKVVYSKETPIIKSDKKTSIGSSAFVPPVAGIFIASEVINDLIED